jgi:dTDP-4-amino-4,6-dideoxygalactose transaminase
MIPVQDLHRQLETVRGEIDASIARVLNRSRFILGEEVEAFEREFAAYCTASHAVGVGSGTEAIQIAVAACNLGPGDEVITVSHTAVGTVAGIEQAGARPVPVDIDPKRYTMDPGCLEAAVTPRTRAILPVHLYGCPADLAPILDIARLRGLYLIEDCAQACGALYRRRRVGSWGHIAAFSFYPTKTLGGFGDGGAVVTSDPDLAERARTLRQYGWDENRVSRRKGINSRLDEIQAAVLRVHLRHLEAWNAERRNLASFYRKSLSSEDILLPQEFEDSQPVHSLYVARHPRRDALRRHLKERGIETSVHYPVPIHLQPAYRNLSVNAGDLPRTESAAREVLTLPLFPGMTEGECEQVADAVRSFHR